MGDLFGLLKSRLDTNARRAVEVYARELPDYRTLAADQRKYAAALDFAVAVRRRAADLAAADEPLTPDDLALIAGVGKERAHQGVSLAAHRQVLGLQSTLTVLEVHEAAGPDELNDLLHMLSWLGAQGIPAGEAYTRGFLDGQQELVPVVTRVQQLARLLLKEDQTAQHLAQTLGIPLSDYYAVTVLRIADKRPRPNQETRNELIQVLLAKDRIPMTWHEPQELVALVPTGRSDPVHALVPAQERALALARGLAELTPHACAIGMATGPADALAETLALARRVSQAAPVQTAPGHVCTAADVFIELGTTQQPHIDQWLREVAGQLARGPNLVTTLDAYYRNDMNRLLTAAGLHIHPRTLDYRIQRVHDLTGINPTSTRGIRTLSTLIGRILSDTWPDTG